MPTDTKTRKTAETPLRQFVRKCGLNEIAVARRIAIPGSEGTKELAVSAFYGILRGERAVKIDEAHAIVATLRAMTGKQVTIEQLWPTNGDGQTA